VILLLAKLILTPSIMYVLSVAGRRWGPGVSGWLTGLPLLAGPISIFICIEQGTSFAAHAAGSTLLGMWSSCAFCLGYDAMAPRGWPAASAAACLAFLAATVLLRELSIPASAGLAGVFVGAWLCLKALAAPASRPAASMPPAWDMPARLSIAAAYVLVQTGIAGWLGPQLSGLITPFPIVVILLTAFAHHQLGRERASRVLRGFLLGMYAFGSFFWVVAVALERLGAVAAYSLAALVCLAINGATLRATRHKL
jgi:hypothetical protein